MKRHFYALALIMCVVACSAFSQTRPSWLDIKNTPFVTSTAFGHGTSKTATQNDAAILLAQAALPNGGTVIIPPGTYEHHVVVVKNNITLLGCGQKATILKLPNNSKTIIDSNTPLGIYPENGIDWFSVQNLTYDGNCENNANWGVGSLLWGVNDYANVSAHGVCAVSFSGDSPNDFLFENVTSINCIRNNFLIGNNSTFADTVKKGRITNCSAKNSQADHLLYISTPRDVLVDGFIGEGYWRGAAIVAYSGTFTNIQIKNPIDNPTVYPIFSSINIRSSEALVASHTPTFSNIHVEFNAGIASAVIYVNGINSLKNGFIINDANVIQLDSSTNPVSFIYNQIGNPATDLATMRIVVSNLIVSNLNGLFTLYRYAGSTTNPDTITNGLTFRTVNLNWITPANGYLSPILFCPCSLKDINIDNFSSNSGGYLFDLSTSPANTTIENVFVNNVEMTASATFGTVNYPSPSATYRNFWIKSSKFVGVTPGSLEKNKIKYKDCIFEVTPSSGVYRYSDRCFVASASGSVTGVYKEHLAYTMPGFIQITCSGINGNLPTHYFSVNSASLSILLNSVATSPAFIVSYSTDSN